MYYKSLQSPDKQIKKKNKNKLSAKVFDKITPEDVHAPNNGNKRIKAFKTKINSKAIWEKSF